MNWLVMKFNVPARRVLAQTKIRILMEYFAKIIVHILYIECLGMTTVAAPGEFDLPSQSF